jgi:hypothetical protein
MSHHHLLVLEFIRQFLTTALLKDITEFLSSPFTECLTENSSVMQQYAPRDVNLPVLPAAA